MAKRTVSGMNGPDFVACLKKKFNAKTERDLARALGVGQPTINNWKRESASISPRIVATTITAAVQAALSQAIRPIVEFYPISKVKSSRSSRYELFSTRKTDGDHHFQKGLRAELEQHHGVYVFFDSRGRALYAGKAKRLVLWSEMNSAFNRAREVQRLRRVAHPERNQQYRDSKEKARQIQPTIVPLHELAIYFSAYEVVDVIINELESLLVRSFANDLLNVRMELFGQQHRVRAAAKTARSHKRTLKKAVAKKPARTPKQTASKARE